MLQRALADLSRLRGDALVGNISVNVHARNLREPDLVARTLSMLKMNGLEPRDLILELTEDALIGEDPAVAQTLIDLDEAGLVLSADDFGSGFSSLSYLNRLPVREMKLDRSLVSQVCDSPRAKAVVESVLGLASRLDLTVVAEGVEDQKTLGYLIEQGCPQGQGFLIGRPAPAEYWMAENQRNYRVKSAQPATVM